VAAVTAGKEKAGYTGEKYKMKRKGLETMVLFVMKWNIHPDKVQEYPQWAQGAIQRTLAAPGVVEFRSYRTAVGSNQAVITYEFADMATWAAWQSQEEVQQALAEAYAMSLNLEMELWGPSPVAPKPIRPGG